MISLDTALTAARQTLTVVNERAERQGYYNGARTDIINSHADARAPPSTCSSKPPNHTGTRGSDKSRCLRRGPPAPAQADGYRLVDGYQGIGPQPRRKRSAWEADVSDEERQAASPHAHMAVLARPGAIFGPEITPDATREVARREPPTGGLVGTAGPLSDRCIACQRGRAGLS